MAPRQEAPREPEQFPVISGMNDEPKPDGEAAQCGFLSDVDYAPPSTDWDAGQFRMFGE